MDYGTNNISEFCDQVSHIGGQVEAWGGAEGVEVGSRGVEGGSGAPSEVGALAWRGGMAILIAVAFGLSTRAATNTILIRYQLM